VEFNWEIILTCFAICGAKILEVSIQSVKTVCMVKGERKLAALLAFVECLVWGFVISSVITSLSSNVFLLLSYCVGYASGLFLGSVIESKIALGTSSVQIMVANDRIERVKAYLKERGHGFTVLDGHGSKETMHVVIMVLARKTVKKTMQEIRKICDGDVFMVSSEISNFTGGYGIRK
jgi:uncharacterized protein YebE (UPF0316 family)